MTSMPMPDIEQRSLAEQVYAYIKKMILSGTLKGGQRIPEETIAQKLGVSRTPIREALRRLQEYGLIEIKRRSYAEVVSLDKEEAKQVIEVRAELECFVVRLLVERATDEDLEILSELANECEEFLTSNDLSEIFEKDSQLHKEMAIRTGNKYLFETLERLDSKVQLYRVSTCLTIDKVANDVRKHKAILDAIRRRDADEAEALMKQHVGLAI